MRGEEVFDEDKLGGADKDSGGTGVGMLRGGGGFGDQGYLEIGM